MTEDDKVQTDTRYIASGKVCKPRKLTDIASGSQPGSSPVSVPVCLCLSYQIVHGLVQITFNIIFPDILEEMLNIILITK